MKQNIVTTPGVLIKLFGNARFSKKIFGATALAVCLASLRANAVTNEWVHSAGSSSWFAPGNWSAGVPAANDDAFIGNDTTAFVEGTTPATAGNLFIDNGGVTIGNIDPGTLNVSGQLSIGTAGSSGKLNLNFGTLSVNTLTIGLSGTYSDTVFGHLNLTGDDPTIRMANGVTVVVNSEVSGTNGLTKGGLGTLVLANNNVYSGGTTITVGTLQIGNGGTTGTLGDGDVVNNGTLAFNRSDTMTVSNQISGTGNLAQNGSGTVILTAGNTYAGSTTISNGTLQVGNGGTTGSLGFGNVNMTNNAKLAFDRSDNITVSNLISGAGSLLQIGGGTTILTADNTYTGTTTITNGTLQIGNGGSTGSLGTGNVTVGTNSSLVFDRNNSMTVSNQISGAGSLSQIGSGTTILAANNSYSGFTTISNGTLQVGNGGTTGSIGTNEVHNFGSLVFNRSDSIAVSNVISGTGRVTQASTNILVLAATNTYSGGTTIENGGTISVGNGHALGSGDVNVENGTLRANFAPATNRIAINVGGDYTQSSDGTLQLTIGGKISNSTTNEYERLDIVGSANLDGTLHIVGDNGYVPHHNDEQIIITADGGITNTFSTFTNDIGHSPLIDPRLIYSSTNVTLAWDQLSFFDYLVTSNGVKLTYNQTATAHGLDSIATSTSTNDQALIDRLDYLSNLTNDLPIALNQIAPEELTAMLVASFANMDAQGNQFLNRANDLRTDYRSMYQSEFTSRVPPGMHLSPNFDKMVDKPWDVYVELPLNFVGVTGDTNASGYDISTFGLNVGADRRLNENLVVGGALGYANSSASLVDSGKLDLNTFNAMAYAVWFKHRLHFEGMLGANLNSYNTERQAIDGIAKGSAFGIGWTGLFSGGYDWVNGPWKIGPQAAVQYESSSINEFTEEGSLSPLQISSQSENAMHSQLGVNVSYRYFFEDSWTVIIPEVYFGWRHEILGSSPSIESRFASGAGDSFTVKGPDFGKDSIIASLGINIQWTPAFSTSMHLVNQMGRSGYDSQNLNFTGKFSF